MLAVNSYSFIKVLCHQPDEDAARSRKRANHFHLFVGRVNPQFHGQGSGFITQLRNNKKNRQFSAVSRRRGELEAYIDFASNCHLELQFTVTIIKQN